MKCGLMHFVCISLFLFIDDGTKRIESDEE